MNREEINNWSPDPKELLTWLTVGAFFGPVLIPAVREAIIAWLIEHQVLVTAGSGAAALPGTGADVPARTIIFIVLLVVIAIALTRLWMRAQVAQTKRQAARERAGGAR